MYPIGNEGQKWIKIKWERTGYKAVWFIGYVVSTISGCMIKSSSSKVNIYSAFGIQINCDNKCQKVEEVRQDRANYL